MPTETTEPVVIQATPEAPKGNEQITIAPEHVTSTAEPTSVAQEPPVTAPADDTTMDAFEALKDGVTLSPPTVVAKKDDKKVETTPVVDKSKTASKVEVTTPVTAEVKKGGRDYTGFPETMHKTLRAMSNEAFSEFQKVSNEASVLRTKVAELEPVVKQYKENPNKIPDTFYEHPLAFALTPEYESAAKQAQEAQVVFQHWSEQLKAVQDGAASYKTLVRDPNTKAIVYGQDVATDKNSAINLLAFFNQTQQNAARLEGAMSTMQQSHQAKYKEQEGSLKSIESQMFKDYENPQHPAQAKIKATIAQLPPAFQKSPMATGYAKALVTIEALMNLVTKERADVASGATAAAKIAATTKAAGPLETGVAAGGQASAVTMDDFDKIKES